MFGFDQRRIEIRSQRAWLAGRTRTSLKVRVVGLTDLDQPRAEVLEVGR